MEHSWESLVFISSFLPSPSFFFFFSQSANAQEIMESNIKYYNKWNKILDSLVRFSNPCSQRDGNNGLGKAVCQDKNAHLKFEFQTPNCWSELLKNHINTSTCRNYLGNKWENSRSQKINCLSSALYTKKDKIHIVVLIVYSFSIVKTLPFSTALTGKY